MAKTKSNPAINSKTKLKSFYSKRLSALRLKYKAKNGDLTGFYKSTSYIKEREKRDEILNKIDKRILFEKELKQAQEIDRITEIQEKDPELITSVRSGEPYYMALNYSEGENSSPVALFDLMDSGKMSVTAIITDHNGNKSVFYRKVDFDLATKQLFRDISKSVKSGKISGSNGAQIRQEIITDIKNRKITILLTVDIIEKK